MKIIFIILVVYLLTNFSLLDAPALKKPIEKNISKISEEKEQEVKHLLQDSIPGVEENSTHINIYFKEEDKSIEITKNKLNKTAETRIIMIIPDEWEYEGPSIIPLTVNFVCTLFATTFFDPEEFKEYQGKFNLQIENQESIFEGYEVTKVTINFIDQETEELIADCTSEGSTKEDIEFNSYKSYENSLFNVRIGEIGTASSTLFNLFSTLIPEEES